MEQSKVRNIIITLLKYLSIFACFIPLLVLRDFTPNNELKYLSIADEALRSGSVFTFWNHGMAYADKPPLYLWIIMTGKWLLGTHSMFFIGLFSILPALLILYVMDKWAEKIIIPEWRLTAQLMLITTGLFIGSAVVLRMDMLMCMFIVLALYTFFKLYTGNSQPINKLLLPIYIFMALFTKGPVGIIVPLLSITTFLLIKKEIRTFGKYLNGKALLLLSGLCLIWFGAVFAEGGNSYLNNLLFNQTVNRAIDSFHHKEPVYYYLKTISYSLAPWTLFYLAVIGIGIYKKQIRTDLQKFFLTIIATTFIALSAFSGKLDIYLLPTFPFFTYLAISLLPEVNKKHIIFTIVLPSILLALMFPALIIIGKHTGFPIFKNPLIPLAVLVLSGISLISLIYCFHKQLSKAANSLSIGLLAAILISSFTIPMFNKNIGFGEMANKAQEIAVEKNMKNYFFYDFRSGENLDAYLQQNIRKVTSEEINVLDSIPDFILFIRNRDTVNNRKINELIKNNKTYSIGDYSVITR